MKRTIAVMLGIFMIGVMLSVVPLARADDSHVIDDQGNRIVLSTGSLTAEFEGMVPKVRFYDNQGMFRTVQQVNFRALIEYNDSDNNKVFETNEKVSAFILDEAVWDHSQFYTLTGGSGIGINFTLRGPANGVQVILVVKAYNTTQTINTPDGRTFTLGRAEIKFDIYIANWPFQNATNRLALQVNLHSSTDHIGTDEQTGTNDVDTSHSEDSGVAEHPFHETSDPEQDMKFSSGLVTTSSSVGFFRFVNTATVTSPSGTHTTVPVTASYKSEADNEAGDKETFMKLYLSYPNFQGTLVHDPTIGLGSGLPTLYFIVGGVAVAGLVAVVAVRRRHLQVQRDSKQNYDRKGGPLPPSPIFFSPSSLIY